MHIDTNLSAYWLTNNPKYLDAYLGRGEREMIELPRDVTNEGELSAFVTRLRLGGLDVKHDRLLTEFKLLAPEAANFWAATLAEALAVRATRERAGDGQKQPLPAEFAEALDRGTLTLADLSSPVLDLGDLSQYDLTPWRQV